MTNPHSKLIVPLAAALFLTLAALLAVRIFSPFDMSHTSSPVTQNPSPVTSHPASATQNPSTANAPPASVTHNPSPAPFPLPAFPPAHTISPAVRTIVGLNGNGKLITRSSALKQLGSRISTTDLHALYAYLDQTSRAGAQNPEAPNILHAVQNDILRALISLDPTPQDVLPALLTLFNDPARDIVTRDYILQHLVPLTQQILEPTPTATNTGTPSPVPSDDLRLIQHAFSAALHETATQLPGTALLGLELLGREHPDYFSPAGTAKVSASLAANPTASLSARTTAVQLCATLGEPSAFDTIVELAQNDQTPSMLRRAAIAALPSLSPANLGRTQTLLASLAANPALTELYDVAIATAQARLQQKINVP